MEVHCVCSIMIQLKLKLSCKFLLEYFNFWCLIAWFSRFIDKYGTHVVVGVKMGGKDVIHVKQLEGSNLQPTEVQKLLKQLADQRFSEDENGGFLSNPAELSGKMKVYIFLKLTSLS